MIFFNLFKCNIVTFDLELGFRKRFRIECWFIRLSLTSPDDIYSIRTIAGCQAFSSDKNCESSTAKTISTMFGKITMLRIGKLEECNNVIFKIKILTKS